MSSAVVVIGEYAHSLNPQIALSDLLRRWSIWTRAEVSRLAVDFSESVEGNLFLRKVLQIESPCSQQEESDCIL